MNNKKYPKISLLKTLKEELALCSGKSKDEILYSLLKALLESTNSDKITITLYKNRTNNYHKKYVVGRNYNFNNGCSRLGYEFIKNRNVYAKVELLKYRKKIKHKNKIKLQIRESMKMLSFLYDKKNIEETLLQSMKTMQELAGSIDGVFFVAKYNYDKIFFINDNVENVLDMKRQAVIDKPEMILEKMNPYDKDRFKTALLTAIKKNIKFDEEFRIYLANDTERWLRMRTFPINKKDEYSARIVGIIEDIDANKKNELEIVKSRDYEFKIGAEIQKRLLLDYPKEINEKIDYYAYTFPSQKIDGDFYNIFRISNNCFDVLIGDVMGKGINAALIGAAAKSGFLQAQLNLITKNKMTEATDRFPAPAEIVTEADRIMVEELIKLNSFITLMYVRFDFAEQEITYVDCGNTPIIHYRRDTDSSWILKGENTPFGFKSDEKYIQYSFPFEKDDLFYFFSDGVSESKSELDEYFGLKRLQHLIRTNSSENAQSIIKRVNYILFNFVGGRGFTDDITSLVIKINEENKNKGIKFVKRFTNDIKDLPKSRIWLRQIFENEGKEYLSNTKKIDEIIIGINESFSNIIRHGKNTENIKITVRIKKSRICAELLYKGVVFNWLEKEHSDINKLEAGGYGIKIINDVFENILFTKDEKDNTATYLVKEIKGT